MAPTGRRVAGEAALHLVLRCIWCCAASGAALQRAADKALIKDTQVFH